ncbi:MAG: hypothetical protein ABI608_05225, partial [Rhizomicrobium sp.]
MRSGRYFLVACAAVIAAAQCFEAQAASLVTRVKARVTAFDGQVMTLEPLAAKPEVPNPGPPKIATPKSGAPQASAPQ